MNSKQRVEAFFKNAPTDRPPLGFWMHFPPECTQNDACVAAHLDYYAKAPLDLVKIMSDGYMDYPNPTAKAIRTPQEWYQMRPLGRKSDFIVKQVERVMRLRDAMKQEHVLLYTMFAPFTYLRFGAGTPLMMEHLAQCPEAVDHAQRIVEEDCRELCEMLLQSGACDGLYFCLHSGETDRMAPETYKAHVAPAELSVLRYADSLPGYIMLHCCGWAGKKNRLSLWTDYPADAVNWAVHVEEVSLSQGHAMFGGKPVCGGFDNTMNGILARGNREQVIAETKNILRSFGSDVGIMLGADCTLPRDFPVEKLQWVAEGAQAV